MKISLGWKLDSRGLEFYLAGDLDYNLAATSFDPNTRLLCEVSHIYALQQLMKVPTRTTESSSSLIDL